MGLSLIVKKLEILIKLYENVRKKKHKLVFYYKLLFASYEKCVYNNIVKGQRKSKSKTDKKRQRNVI